MLDRQVELWPATQQQTPQRTFRIDVGAAEAVASLPPSPPPGGAQQTSKVIDLDNGESQTVLHTALHTQMCLIVLAPPPLPSPSMARSGRACSKTDPS